MVIPAIAFQLPETMRWMVEFYPPVTVTAPMELLEPVTLMMTVAFSVAITAPPTKTL